LRDVAANYSALRIGKGFRYSGGVVRKGTALARRYAHGSLNAGVEAMGRSWRNWRR
jgi:hypothetical protein